MKLIQKLQSITKDAGPLQKTGFNDFGKYQYAKEEDVLNTLKPLFDRHGVFISFSVKGAQQTLMQSQKGTREVFYEVLVEYTIHDVESEEKLILQGIGAGIDSGDKGLYKALTGAHKYFLSKNFNLCTGDDPESEAESDKPYAADKKSAPDKLSLVDKLSTNGVRSYDPSFTMPIGKKKGTRLDECSIQDVIGAAAWIKKTIMENDSTGKASPQKWYDFLVQATLMEEELANMNDANEDIKY